MACGSAELAGWSAPLAVALLLACATPGPDGRPPLPEWDPARSEGAAGFESILLALPRAEDGSVQVRLAFGPGVDLDLYVSDPLQETVYYANTPSESGGHLDGDRRCEPAAKDGPRVETIVFPAAPSGRYRVGVDYARRCDPDADVVPFAVSVEAGGQRSAHRGLAEPFVRQPKVTEFTASGPAGGS